MEIPGAPDGEDAVVDRYNELVMVKKRGSIMGRVQCWQRKRKVRDDDC